MQEIGKAYYPADFLATMGNRQFLIEYKRRFFNHNKYPTFQMFGRKLAEVRMLSYYMGLEPVLISQWDDAIGWLNLRNITPSVVLGGRTDRGRNETEPCVDIPLEYFIRIG